MHILGYSYEPFVHISAIFVIKEPATIFEKVEVAPIRETHFSMILHFAILFEPISPVPVRAFSNDNTISDKSVENNS